MNQSRRQMMIAGPARAYSRRELPKVILVIVFLLVGFFVTWPFQNYSVPFGINPAAAADISYVYDELGRLRAVIDPTSDTAVYNYDAVGNLLSITRQSSSTVSIIEFNPNSGPVGTVVTIFGTGFSATPSQNTVTFNGTTATVTSSTTTNIVATVPAGATTGPIGVTSPSGSAGSSKVFTITGSSGGPTITAFMPNIGTPGTPVTVTGTNFQDDAINNNVKFNNTRAKITSATSTSIATSVPSAAGSGRIGVSTPFGAAVSTADFFIPPSPYTAADVEFTGRMAIGGSSLTATISTANKIGLIVFDGTAGQKMNLGINNSTLTSCCLRIYNPNSTVLVQTLMWTATNVNMTLPVTGTYTILIDPTDTSTGSITLTLSEEINAGTIVINGPSATVAINRVGQRAYLTFSGTAGQKMNLGVDNSTLPGCCHQLIIYKPDTTVLVSNANMVTGTNLNATLPVTGTYTILIDPSGTSTGSVTLTLSEEMNAGTVAVDGASASVTLSRVGQRAYLTFTGTAGQFVSLGINSTTLSGNSDLWVYNPDGTQLAFENTLSISDNLHLTLPSTGTYSILIDPDSTSTGSITLTLSSEVNAGTIVIDGSSVTATITRVGQRARITLSGTAGQLVSLGINSTTLALGTDLFMYNPDGTQLTSSTILATTVNLHMTLPGTGTYSIVIDPDGTSTGNVSITLSSEVNGGTVNINSGAAPISINRVGQRARVTFSGASGQQATVRITSNTMGLVAVTLYKPDSNQLTTLSSSASSFNLASQTLPTPGTYTILIDPNSTNMGSLNIAVTSP